MLSVDSHNPQDWAATFEDLVADGSGPDGNNQGANNEPDPRVETRAATTPKNIAVREFLELLEDEYEYEEEEIPENTFPMEVMESISRHKKNHLPWKHERR